MSIIKWDPFKDLGNFFDEDIVPFVPAVKVNEMPIDVYEKDGKVFVEMPLAGYKPEEVNVEIEGNYLKVSGKAEEKKEEKNKNYYRKEVRKGSFERMINLPEGVSPDKGNAEFEDGLLKIVFPVESKRKEKVKKIKIKKK